MCAHAKWKFLVAGILVLMAGPAFGDDAGLPDYNLSFATLAYQGPETLTLMVVPDGSGGYFSTARTATGAPADAMITLVLVDATNTPMANYPREDIWLQSTDNDLSVCTSYWACHPDTDTNAAGETRWLLAPRIFGSHEGPVTVYINNTPLASSGPLLLSFNGPDINGDRHVGLDDVAAFAQDYFGGYQFRSDLHRDGVINLSDVIPLARWMGRYCN